MRAVRLLDHPVPVWLLKVEVQHPLHPPLHSHQLNDLVLAAMRFCA